MRFLLFLLVLMQFLFVPPAVLYAGEAETEIVSKDNPQSSLIDIGDPKEIFLTKKKPKKQAESNTKENREAKTMSEFLFLLKSDFKKIGKEVSKIKTEWEEQQRHTFHDPDFTPPTRPDWR